MSEFWVEKRGHRESRLEFSSLLGNVVPVQQGQRLSCVHLRLEAQLLNVYRCVVSLRYAGNESWQDLAMENQTCSNQLAFIEAMAVSVDLLKIVPRRGSLVDIYMDNYANHDTPIEYKFNASLAAILGVGSEEVFAGRISGYFNVNALIENVAVLSPLVRQAISVNTSDLCSVGTFRLKMDVKEHRILDCVKLVTSTSPDALCLPALLSRLDFSVNSLLVPSLVLRATSFRLLACFVLSNNT
jgi:hypothetical protein